MIRLRFQDRNNVRTIETRKNKPVENRGHMRPLLCKTLSARYDLTILSPAPGRNILRKRDDLIARGAHICPARSITLKIPGIWSCRELLRLRTAGMLSIPPLYISDR